MKKTFEEVMEIVGYPEGNILEITKKQFDLLNEKDLVKFDDDWTPETPNGQWGFNNSDEYIITELIKKVKMKKETLEDAIGNWIDDNCDRTDGLETLSDAIKFGAKWQMKRSYSEEEVLNIIADCDGSVTQAKKWFEQFKNK